MTKNLPDFSIFEKFNFERSPVGIKFHFQKPDGIKKLGKKVRLCAMLTEAQNSNAPFYVDKDDEECGYAGSWVLGWCETPKEWAAGGLGIVDSTFKEPRANRRLYDFLPMLEIGTMNYLSFSPLSELNFDPDLLILMTDTDSQTEVILRAMSYTTGKPWISRLTGVMGCAWIYVYPYKTGEVNYLNTGILYGPKRYKIYPPDKQIISIPFDWIPTIARNLQQMTWTLPEYK